MEEHPQARFIVNTLAKAGFIAYYAGGWVRDYLLGHSSDDIDIATNAAPETIQALFPHTVPIGIAFGIILVIIEGRQYEVATFRQDFDYQDGRRPTRVVFSTAIEDARRRDFTINGMFYDPLKGEILDYVEGKADLERKVIRAIGNPHERIREDRLRMIRACRLSCRFGFFIEPATEQAIRAHARELFPSVAVERVYQEFTKGHKFGKLASLLLQLHELGLLPTVFPSLEGVSSPEIAQRLRFLAKYPVDAPVIASLLPLFPHHTLEGALDVCKQFKLSNEEQQFVSFLYRARHQAPTDRWEWAYFYTSPFADLTLSILAAHLAPCDQSAFVQEHEKRRLALRPAVDRILRRDPALKSEDLLKEGIPPGKAMGQLLKEGEKIAINEDLFDTALIIQRLKTLPIWVQETP